MPKLLKGNYPYKACIVKSNAGELTFVCWLKPATYLHNIPEFMRDEFSKTKGNLLKPKYVKGLPLATYDTPEKIDPEVSLKSFRKGKRK